MGCLRGGGRRRAGENACIERGGCSEERVQHCADEGQEVSRVHEHTADAHTEQAASGRG